MTQPADPLARELLALHGLLVRAVEVGRLSGALSGAGTETVAGQAPATVEDYASARDLVRRLAAQVGGMAAGDRERLELSPDLRQLAFHLREELDALPAVPDRDALARSLTFLKRHIVALRGEHVERRHLRLPPDERELVLDLARLARRRYDERFAAAYAAAGHRRPFVDKFLRDYGLAGIPDGLLLELAGIAARDAYDRYVCVMKGGLTYALVLELCGIAPERIVHVLCGRASGSHVAPTYVFRPLDFALDELRGLRVLVVENNAATGRTLAHLGASLSRAGAAAMDLLLDYVLEDVAGLTAAALRAGPAGAFDRVRIGPYPAPEGTGRQAAEVRSRLLAASRDALVSAGPSAPPTAPARRRSAADARR